MSKPTEALSGLTTGEKASLTSGASFWNTKAIEHAGVPSIMLTDGPHGVRKQREGGDHLGLMDSVPATCFPPAVALGSIWDPELVGRVGVALGEEAKAEGVGILLGPGINIKRSPLGGRNFEYLSEDPYISGVLGAALVNGLQSQGVGASLKHFAANNQETDRLRVSADVDERPLREIYLRGFQRVVTEARPWTVMCSYNKINGVYASEDPWLLTDVLRGEWGFDGLVVSDWGAVNDRVAGLAAGLDLEMPSSGGVTDTQIVAAVADGSLDESVLDTAAHRVLTMVERVVDGADASAGYDVQAHHALAREAAGRGIVLLKNDGGLLPLARGANVAVIGEFARTPRYQGAGSSQINPTKLDNALDEIRVQAPGAVFAAGYTVDSADGEDGSPAGLVAEAVAAAAAADVALLFLGLPSGDESEGFDRTHLELPAEQTELIEAVLAANPRTVVVLSNGSVVRLSGWGQRVPAIVEGWLLGQAGGGAIADVLFGVVNPSGRLAETIPLELAHTPAYLDFPGENSHVRYGEGLFVGYRYYDARTMEVSYPFGHGLSYTSFGYAGLEVAASESGLSVSLDVQNTGSRTGRDVVQVYVGLPGSAVVRAPRELRAFATVALEPGETRHISLDIPREELAYWNVPASGWTVETGSYTVEVGASSRDIRLSASVAVAGDDVVLPLDTDSTLAEWMAHPVGGQVLGGAFAAAQASGGGGEMLALMSDPSLVKMIGSMPLGRIAAFPGSPLTPHVLDQLVAAGNA
ncbi:glycoside hydrolase family 3 C-terminal domain-containing protein [Arthrobacter sp. 35W]|uniref:glycoside hydrolase family 3 C-terminal domain-containing protein n=1 Tax=Arthrobacter sp. 35W TaxID=1132441 RepID=UPI00042A699B|nr:glycoside hydrolase family 3 C-terminal domain-containing protein [Arthrobacter sp. 35W]